MAVVARRRLRDREGHLIMRDVVLVTHAGLDGDHAQAAMRGIFDCMKRRSEKHGHDDIQCIKLERDRITLVVQLQERDEDQDRFLYELRGDYEAATNEAIRELKTERRIPDRSYRASGHAIDQHVFRHSFDAGCAWPIGSVEHVASNIFAKTPCLVEALRIRIDESTMTVRVRLLAERRTKIEREWVDAAVLAASEARPAGVRIVIEPE